ncbi:DUF6907 domain-containing protein [Streptomyces sp. LZ34]
MPTVTRTHPTPCPSWCKDREHQSRHHFGPTSTAHWSPQYQVANRRPLPDTIPVILRAELSRIDEGDRRGETVLYVSGESDIDCDRDEADVLIADVRAFLTALVTMRRQMG